MLHIRRRLRPSEAAKREPVGHPGHVRGGPGVKAELLQQSNRPRQKQECHNCLYMWCSSDWAYNAALAAPAKRCDGVGLRGLPDVQPSTP